MKLSAVIHREVRGAEVEVRIVGHLAKADPAVGQPRPYVEVDSYAVAGVETHPDELGKDERAEALLALEEQREARR